MRGSRVVNSVYPSRAPCFLGCVSIDMVFGEKHWIPTIERSEGIILADLDLLVGLSIDGPSSSIMPSLGLR